MKRYRTSVSEDVDISPDIWSLYALMLRSRLFEEAIAQLWRDGLISDEMHLADQRGYGHACPNSWRKIIC